MVHPDFDLGSVLLINAQHLAQGEQRQLFRKELDEINHRALFLHFIQQSIDFKANLVSDGVDVARKEKLTLLHAHFTVQGFIEVDQGVVGRRHQFFRAPMLTLRHAHIDAAAL